MKQKVADIKNSYKSGLASASKGAALIEYFVEKDKTLVHLYISWLSQNIFNKGLFADGTTGFGTQLTLN